MIHLKIEDLEVTYGARSGRKPVRAVAGVSLEIEQGETFGIVGESGCGKTTLANAVIGLVPTAGGRVWFEGSDLTAAEPLAGGPMRRRMQMVFQDPFGSLNPRLTVATALSEAVSLHSPVMTGCERDEAVTGLLRSVGMDRHHARRYPHELSGGQRQRVGIARALAPGPSLVIADEPVSALDVSVQVQIIDLLRELRETRGRTYLFIAHDLAVVRMVCDRVAVMYLGRIVESAPAGELFASPAHPYTRALLEAVPDVERGLAARGGGRQRSPLRGDVPSAGAQTPGCPFNTRCPRAQTVCREIPPPTRAPGPAHIIVCHFEPFC